MSFPQPVTKQVREKPVEPGQELDVLNREVIPVLRDVRACLNLLLQHFQQPTDITGSRADPEQALAELLARMDALQLANDETTP